MKPGFRFGVRILGSGGGGYLLGFTDEKERAMDLLRDRDVLWLNETESSERTGGAKS